MAKTPLPEYVWDFDGNRRVYPPLTDEQRAAGRVWSSGGPIYREHWKRWRVTGESRAYWLVDGPAGEHRVKKLGALTSEQALEDDCYVHDNRHKIADSVRDVKDADVLRQIAALALRETRRDAQ